MADETDLQAEVTDQVAVPEDGQGADPNANGSAADPIAALATEMGWAPKDQFRGDPSDWKDAAEYIKAGHEIQRHSSRELRGMREQIDRLTRTSSQIMADRIAERDAYWQGKHAEAVEAGDATAAQQAVEERIKLKNVAPASEAPPPETRDFIDRNKTWFEVDPLATLRAKNLAEELAKQGVRPADQLRHVERAIRKEFPEHFPAPAKTPPGVQTGQARSTGQGSKAKGFADMPAESQQMAKDYLKRHGISLEKFAESYWAENERKVG